MRRLALALGVLGLSLLLVSAIPGLAPASGRTSPPSGDAERGKALFLAKGCATCHVNRRVPGRTGEFARAYGARDAPDLTGYANDPDLLRRWLRDPAAVKPGTAMPNLNLSDDEIADLIAFLGARP